jgi:hypothetical protein
MRGCPWLARGAGEIAEINGEGFVFEVDGLFAFDALVRVEELVGDVGEDGGAARGNAAFGDEGEETGEELADVHGGIELGELGEEVGGEVFGVGLQGKWAGVTETETGLSVQDAMAALAAVDGEMAAAGRVFGGARYRKQLSHFNSP